MQRIGARHFFHEVHFRPRLDHAVHRAVREVADLGFDLAKIARHEPVHGELAIFGMDRRIENDKAIDQHIRSRRGLRESSRLARCKDDWFGIVEEGLVVLRDAHHVFVAGDEPEGFKRVILSHDFRHWHFVAKAVEGVENAAPLAIAGGRDNLAGGFLGKNGRRAHGLCIRLCRILIAKLALVELAVCLARKIGAEVELLGHFDAGQVGREEVA